MKYFTPQLLAAYGSRDSATWTQAEALWEEQCERYNAILEEVKEHFPNGLRQIEEQYHLHDATVRGMGWRDGGFVIVLQPVAPPCPLLTFNYDLVEPPSIDPEALPAELRGRGNVVEWLYDEIERVPDAADSWRQAILFSNGWEVRLNFRDVRVDETRTLVPTPPGVAIPTLLTAMP